MIFIYRGHYIRLMFQFLHTLPFSWWHNYENLFQNFLPSIKYHHRLNLDEQLPLMEPGTKIITTIRQPLSFLHSSYNYFYGKYEDVQSQGYKHKRHLDEAFILTHAAPTCGEIFTWSNSPFFIQHAARGRRMSQGKGLVDYSYPC